MLFPHRLQFRPSRYLALVLALLHLAGVLGLLPLHIPLWFKLALVAAILASLGVSIRRHALLQAASSVRELVLKNDGAAEGLRNDGGRFDVKVSSQTTVHSWMIVMLLEFPGSGRWHPLVILPDSLPAEDGRILRAWLRWKLI